MFVALVLIAKCYSNYAAVFLGCKLPSELKRSHYIIGSVGSLNNSVTNHFLSMFIVNSSPTMVNKDLQELVDGYH